LAERLAEVFGALDGLRPGFTAFGRLDADFAAAGLTLEADFGFADGLDLTDKAGLPTPGPAFARLAARAFALVTDGFGVFAAATFAFRFAAGFAFRADIRESAAPAAALPRFLGFAMVLASIPPRVARCGHHTQPDARLQFKRAF
jgi:hypothetical protein